MNEEVDPPILLSSSVLLSYMVVLWLGWVRHRWGKALQRKSQSSPQSAVEAVRTSRYVCCLSRIVHHMTRFDVRYGSLLNISRVQKCVSWMSGAFKILVLFYSLGKFSWSTAKGAMSSAGKIFGIYFIFVDAVRRRVASNGGPNSWSLSK